MSKKVFFKHIVLQPTTLCNLNCSYCYLPDRSINKPMHAEIAEAVAKSLTEIEHPLGLVWHGSEPLAAGINKFKELLEPFSGLEAEGKVNHSIQTNATLINDEWCDLLCKHSFGVGVSIDGDRQHNKERVTWGGSESFDRALQGIDLLHRHHIPFGIIAVVNNSNITDARGLYRFFKQFGCRTLNINIEEQEGLNAAAQPLTPDLVKVFWQELFDEWLSDPIVKVREISNALAWIDNHAREEQEYYYSRDFWPTVDINGDVVVLSPEFVSAPASERKNFVVGNVLENNLSDIVEQSLNFWYVRDFFDGIAQCQQTCEYYEFCGGGQASNKYFEHDRTDITETNHCRNTRQLLLDAAVESLETLANSEM